MSGEQGEYGSVLKFQALLHWYDITQQTLTEWWADTPVFLQ